MSDIFHGFIHCLDMVIVSCILFTGHEHILSFFSIISTPTFLPITNQLSAGFSSWYVDIHLINYGDQRPETDVSFEHCT